MSGPILGVIADDLTGACDVADAIARSGLSTLVLLGVPESDVVPDPGLAADADCVVVALKSRTVEPSLAVSMSVAAATWLSDRGVRWLYQKYCSTFDSTDLGNIGPVADALAGVLAERHGPLGQSILTVGTPATPAVGRTQHLGHLFVGDQLLSESPLRHHPLTPMTDSNLVRVLGRQTPHPVRLVGIGTVRQGRDAVHREITALAEAGASHVLVDATTDEDLDELAAALTRGPADASVVIAGAAGLAGALARELAAAGASRGPAPRQPQEDRSPVVPAGRRLIVSGSASARSQEQAAAFRGRVVSFDPVDVATGEVTLDDLCGRLARELDGADGTPVLVAPAGATAPDHTDRVRAAQEVLGTEASAAVVEGTLAALAERAVARLGVTSVIVAGGETSGAVAAALGVRALHLGRSVAPGVPWMVAATAGATTVSLLLKSGNFGGADLFTTAWAVAP